ncbi:MAG: peroxide stress protein YaaA, partial [Betaproteobacteria bacterium]
MLLLLSPAKSLDYDSPLPAGLARKATEPAFVAHAAELIGLLRPLKAGQIASLMDLSDKLASLNAARYAAWSPK